MPVTHDPLVTAHDARHEETRGVPEPPEGGVDARGHRGPLLFHGPRSSARVEHRALAAALARAPVERRASDVQLGPDPVVEAMAMLRDAVFLRVRVLKKVFEGRVMRLEPARASTPIAPPAVEVVLSTDVDERPLRLDGAFATAFWASGADVGDIVQIDKTTPIVAIRADREASEGWVHEERDFVYRTALGDLDRGRAGHRGPFLGTGRAPTPGLDAMRATDQEAEERLATKGTRLEPGLILVTDAEALPESALALVAASVGAPGAPLVLLQTSSDDAFSRLLRRFDDPLVVGGAA